MMCRLGFRAVGLYAALIVAASWRGDVAGQEPATDEPTLANAANRLAQESSPYLLQHAHNPVDWYPWGDEAIARAKRENKPIFLSVGYAACHWCHVMERESFVDPEIAALMNEHFVCIKVDREERPDVDQIYMTAVQLMTGQGGWPMSVFLTPETNPFWGGTYFPARDGDQGAATGFKTILTKLHELWVNDPDAVRRQGDVVTDAIRSNQPGRSDGSDEQPDNEPETLPDRTDLLRVTQAISDQFDPEFGGFGYSPINPQRPKFPEPSNLVFLIDQAQRESLSSVQRTAAMEMLQLSLDGMLSGAMWDHLGGGFHRYSVDRRWQIPHFEKMLYDNGQLASVYAEAFELTGRAEYKTVAKRICQFVLRELRAPENAFFSSLDADSEGEEGKYYAWTAAEIADLQRRNDDSIDLAVDVFRLDGQPNFESERYVPAPGSSLTANAGERNTTFAELDEQLLPARETMSAIRQQRQRPATDTKILTAWNGLMIAGLADVGRILDRAEFVEAASAAADFLVRKLQQPNGRLRRSYADGQAKLNAYVDDYAFLAAGMFALHRATGDAKWLGLGRELVDTQIEWFWDDQSGGFFFTSSDHPELIVRLKDPIDSAIPSAASISATNLSYLAEQTGASEYSERLEQTLRAAKPMFEIAPAGVPRLAAVVAEVLDQEER